MPRRSGPDDPHGVRWPILHWPAPRGWPGTHLAQEDPHGSASILTPKARRWPYAHGLMRRRMPCRRRVSHRPRRPFAAVLSLGPRIGMPPAACGGGHPTAVGAAHTQEHDQHDEQYSDSCWCQSVAKEMAGGKGQRYRPGEEESGGEGGCAHDVPDREGAIAGFRDGACRGRAIDWQVGEQGGQFFPRAGAQGLPGSLVEFAGCDPANLGRPCSARTGPRSRSASDTRRSPGGKLLPTSSIIGAPQERDSGPPAFGLIHYASVS
jgi:hypothetical protein